MKKYRNYMREIFCRLRAVDLALSKLTKATALTGYKETDIEFIFLQFRHCLELMMFAAVSANYHYGTEISEQILRKEYNASKLMKFIKQRNPKFYPQPIESYYKVNFDGTSKTIPVINGFLTQADFCTLYDKVCGQMLHAQRKPKFGQDHTSLIEESEYYRDRLTRLLSYHWIQLRDDICFQVVRKDITDVHISIYGKALPGQQVKNQ